MAGILANSATKVMVGSDTSATKTVSGYVTAQQIALTVTPTQADYTWSIARPSGATTRSDLSSTTDAAPVFTPDVAGNYVVSVTLTDGTVYDITIGVVSTALVAMLGAINLLPQADASVTTPTNGVAVFCGSDHSNVLCVKTTASVVHTVNIT